MNRSPNDSSDLSSGHSSAKGGTHQARRLREALSSAQSQIQDLQGALRQALVEKQEAEEEARRLEEQIEILEELQEEAWGLIYENGLTDTFDFPVSHEAITLYQAVETPAMLGDVRRAARELECSEEETFRLIDELLQEEMWRGASSEEAGEDAVFRSTGHEPFL